LRSIGSGQLDLGDDGAAGLVEQDVGIRFEAAVGTAKSEQTLELELVGITHARGFLS